MTQYLSGVFNSLKKQFPTLVLWHLDTNRDGVPRWYISIRKYIVSTVMQRFIEEGTKLQEKSEPIGRNLLCIIGRTLLLRNDVESVEMRAAFNVDYNSCGRRGEIATASYGTALWDDVQ